MALGDYLGGFSDSSLNRIVLRNLGVTDLHTHMRLRPLVEYFSRVDIGAKQMHLLEIGCGAGINLFEIARRRQITGEGFDLNCESIEIAQRISRDLFDGRIRFFCEDASKIQLENKYDYILFIDFLEHVTDPVKVIREVDGKLRTGGCIVVSVPTVIYPKVFGRRFHRKLGHVMDGYTLEMLCEQFPQNYSLVESSYNTGLPAGIGCFLFYRLVNNIGNKYLRIPLEISLQVFRKLDFINNKHVSCSLFALFRKNGNIT